MKYISAQEQEFREVVILLEKGIVENYQSPQGGALSGRLMNLMHDKSVPVIVEGAILHAVFKVWELGRNKHKHSDFQDSYTDAYIEEAKFCFLDWKIYKHKKEDFYLLIPVKYTESQASSSSGENLFVEGGFSIKSLESIKTENELKEHLSKWEDGYSKVKLRVKELISVLPFSSDNSFCSNLEALKEFFVPESGRWNIFLDGHGWYFGSKHFMLPRGMALPGSTCSLSAKQFNDFLYFCAKDIQTFSLFISTCYAGSTKLELINKQMQNIESQKMNSFIVISCCAFDTGVYSNGLSNFRQYFDEIKRNSDAISEYLKPAQPIRIMQDEERVRLYSLLASIIRPARAVVETQSNKYRLNRLENDAGFGAFYPPLDPYKIQSYLASVRLPYWSSFKATPLDNRFINVDEANEKDVAQNFGESIVLLHSESFSRELLLEKVNAIFSMVPGPSIQELNKVRALWMDKRGFLKTFSHLLTPYKKLFCIKKLDLVGGDLEDVVIYRNPKKINFYGKITELEVEMLANQKLDQEKKTLYVKLNLSDRDDFSGKQQVTEDEFEQNITRKKVHFESRENWTETDISPNEKRIRTDRLLKLIHLYRKR